MQNSLNEIWKDVVDYENVYEVSNLGNVRRHLKATYHKTKAGNITSQRLNKLGYSIVCLSYKNKSQLKTVHQLVAAAFLPNFKYGDIVNHIDGNKQNNRVDNLEKSTPSKNNQHAYQTGLKPVNGKRTTYKGVSVGYKRRQRKDGSWWVGTYYIAKITINSKKIYIGQSPSELEAAKMYDKYIDDNNITTHSKNFA